MQKKYHTNNKRPHKNDVKYLPVLWPNCFLLIHNSSPFQHTKYMQNWFLFIFRFKFSTRTIETTTSKHKFYCTYDAISQVRLLATCDSEWKIGLCDFKTHFFYSSLFCKLVWNAKRILHCMKDRSVSRFEKFSQDGTFSESFSWADFYPAKFLEIFPLPLSNLLQGTL